MSSVFLLHFRERIQQAGKQNSMKSQIKTNKTLGIFKNTWKVTEFCVVVKLLLGERGG